MATWLAFVAFLALIGLPIYLMWNRPTRHGSGSRKSNLTYGPGDASYDSHHDASDAAGSHGDSGGHGGGDGGGSGGDGGGGAH
jgi:hypothetical protein